MATATRGDLAYRLFEALGIQPTGSGRFTDGGYLDSITTTLSDLGITNGVNPEQYGVNQPTTRGQAFTMIARALGLADANDSIERASQALVDAGIVRGYGNDPRNLGLEDALSSDHLSTLIGRLGPELNRATDDGGTVRDRIAIRADDERDARTSRNDPAYAAYLEQLGISRGRIDDEIRLRTDLYNADSLRRAEAYGRMADKAAKGIGTDFENRGLYRSGTRVQFQQDRRDEIGHEMNDAQTAAQRDWESGNRALRRDKLDLNREAAAQRLAAGTRGRERDIERAVGI